MRVLMLAPWMKMGHGVSEMIACLAPELARLGVSTSVGCMGRDDHFKGLDIAGVTPTPEAVAALAAKRGAQVVIALGSPYFEVLPHLGGRFRTIAYEAGDPTPDLFELDADKRREIVENKRRYVYPHVDVVAAISEFIRHDIAWPDAVVLTLGVDNVPDVGPKPVSPPPIRRPLHVGALTRMGVGEARYKGVQELLRLKQELDALDVDAELHIMGRGTPQDAKVFADRGFQVHLNASERERNEYLRSIDVFVSTSLWEGTNLPLVEAQSVGTPGLAFDTGAHPEFTPLLFTDPASMALQIQAYAADREGLLAEHGRMCYRFVRGRMRWEDTARGLVRLARGEASAPPPVARWQGSRPGWRNVARSIKHEGVRATAAKVSAAVRARV